MAKLIRILLLSMAVLSTGCEPPRTRPLISKHTAAGLNYVQVIPISADETSALPMVVLIHGLGDRPRPGWVSHDAPPARYILPRAPLAHGSRPGHGYSWFPYRIGDANPDLDGHIAATTGQLAEFLREVTARHATVGAAIVSGFSQGGILTYALALEHPELVSCAHPIAGVLPESLWPKSPIKGPSKPPIRAAHGEADPIIPVAPTLAMASALRKRGFDLQVQTFAAVGHRVSPGMEDMANRFVQKAILAAHD